MKNLIGKKYNPVDVWNNSVDVYTELTVTEQNEKAVRFNNGTSARTNPKDQNKVLGFVEVK